MIMQCFDVVSSVLVTGEVFLKSELKSERSENSG
jgi:hypothetical protein